MANINRVNFLLQTILKTYFFNSRCIFLFTDPINEIELQTELPVIYFVVDKNTLNPNLIFRHYGCQEIIIHHENATDLFVQFEKLIKTKIERFNGRRYLIVGENPAEIFQSPELQYVSDLLLVVPNGTWYDLCTHWYQTTTVVDRWFPDNASFLNGGTGLFPDKFRDQNGRPLRIGTFTYEPYSVVDEDNQRFDGTETSFISLFVNKYNLTPVFTVIGDDLWGDIYENGTGIGLLGSLADDQIDIGYGAVYTWEEFYKFLDYSKPLTRTGITCLVPAPRLASGWFTPLYSFSLTMWMALLVVLLSDVVVFSVIFRGHLQDSIMTVLKLYLLQSLTISLKGRVLKYFVALNMLIVLLLSSAYSSGLSSVMTVPRYEKAIKTVKDLALSGLPWGAPTDAWLISLRRVEEEDYITIKRQFVVKNEQDLRAASVRHDFGFSLERLPYGHYAVGPYVKGDIISDYRIMQEDIYWEQCIFMVRKNSVLLPLLDDLILRVFEAGLEAYWENQVDLEVVAQYMDMKVQRGIMYYLHSVQEHETVKLKWTHVEGAFAILIVGYVISTVIFLVEAAARTRRFDIRNDVTK